MMRRGGPRRPREAVRVEAWRLQLPRGAVTRCLDVLLGCRRIDSRGYKIGATNSSGESVPGLNKECAVASSPASGLLPRWQLLEMVCNPAALHHQTPKTEAILPEIVDLIDTRCPLCMYTPVHRSWRGGCWKLRELSCVNCQLSSFWWNLDTSQGTAQPINLEPSTGDQGTEGSSQTSPKGRAPDKASKLEWVRKIECAFGRLRPARH
jgi:hypothetical protein